MSTSHPMMRLAPLSMPASSQETRALPPIGISRSLTIRLYTSHFLSTWNSRLFEAAVIYFLASVFPGTLLPISVYALTHNAAAIALTVPAVIGSTVLTA